MNNDRPRRQTTLKSVLARTLPACFLLFAPHPQAARYEPPVIDRAWTDLGGQDWKFIGSNSLTGAEAVGYNDASWATVKVPHTWNTKTDRTTHSHAWYRTHLQGTGADTAGGKRFYLHFGGANANADVYLNGTLLGRHVGGYTAFIFDATAARKDGDNVLAVKVDNASFPGLPSNGNGWVHYGGLIRTVRKLATNAYGIDPTDFASPGSLHLPEKRRQRQCRPFHPHHAAQRFGNRQDLRGEPRGLRQLGRNRGHPAGQPAGPGECQVLPGSGGQYPESQIVVAGQPVPLQDLRRAARGRRREGHGRPAHRLPILPAHREFLHHQRCADVPARRRPACGERICMERPGQPRHQEAIRRGPGYGDEPDPAGPLPPFAGRLLPRRRARPGSVHRERPVPEQRERGQRRAGR